MALDVLKRCFPSKLAGWTPKLKEMIPSYGERLNADAAKARQNMAYTAAPAAAFLASALLNFFLSFLSSNNIQSTFVSKLNESTL